ncbi:MAG: hypothetical protein K2H56_00845 [Malacoplasma sp.]|nr:hypothetical protein [Malacoplasma sp.]
MIEYILGKVSYKNSNYLILENNFKGYKVYMSDLASIEENSNIKVFVYTRVYQNNKSNFVFEYYGFKSIREKFFFETLLSINGIGPKTSLLILKNNIDMLKELIKNEDVESLSILEGFNQKIALSIISALSFKFKKENWIEYENNKSNEKSDESKINKYNPIPDLISALKALGYKKSEIEKAMNCLVSEISDVTEDDLSDLISKAIKVILNETVTN